jgi:hypothetical protein
LVEAGRIEIGLRKSWKIFESGERVGIGRRRKIAGRFKAVGRRVREGKNERRVVEGGRRGRGRWERRQLMLGVWNRISWYAKKVLTVAVRC